MRGQALLRFHTGGSNVSPNQTLLPPSKLGGELEPNDHVGSRQLLPPSGHARTEGLSPKKVHFTGGNASQRCLPGLWQGIVVHPMAVAIGSSSIAPIGALGMVVQTIRKLLHHS